MEILLFDTLPSTQQYLTQQLKKGLLSPPVAVVSNEQDQGIGSRDNSWCGGEGNLYLSFALSNSQLPSDLPLTSYSIYFGTLFQMTLASLGSKAWVKWPNDIYVNDKKVGGIITTVFGQNVVCGVGCNLKNSPNYATVIDVEIDKKILINNYLAKIEKCISWKEVFSIFSVQFDNSKSYQFHNGEGGVSMENALLCEDGSLILNKQRMTSNR